MSGSIPDVELDGTVVSVENHWVYFDSEGSNVLLLELSSQMALDEGGLADTTITNEN